MHPQIVIVESLVIFFAPIIGHTINIKNFRRERGCGIGFYIATIATEAAMGVVGSIIVMQFSRCRGYHVNVSSLTLADRSFMIDAFKLRIKSPNIESSA